MVALFGWLVLIGWLGWLGHRQGFTPHHLIAIGCEDFECLFVGLGVVLGWSWGRSWGFLGRLGEVLEESGVVLEGSWGGLGEDWVPRPAGLAPDSPGLAPDSPHLDAKLRQNGVQDRPKTYIK